VNPITLGTSTLMIAAGAIMRYAVTVKGHGFNVHTVGMILMIVGIAGAVVSFAMYVTATRHPTTAAGGPSTVIVRDQHQH
jgi:hypothetical protein